MECPVCGKRMKYDEDYGGWVCDFCGNIIYDEDFGDDFDF